LFDDQACLSEILKELAGFDLVDRINVLKVLKVKLWKSHAENQKNEFAQNTAFVDTFIQLYIKASEFFKGMFRHLTSTSFGMFFLPCYFFRTVIKIKNIFKISNFIILKLTV
jgi:hypothetical protein